MSSSIEGKRLEQANPRGTRFNDILIGIEAADIVIGLGGSDVLRGMGNDDVLIGVNVAKKPGRNEVDALYGGTGRDTFVLGNFNDGVFYLDKNKKGGGKKSYAAIQDFEDGDKISLRCYEIGEYELDKDFRVGNSIATAILYEGDLIAVVQGAAASSLDLFDNNQFNFIV
jgi:Ca2+-binding RTX toxin-like protein